jgi:hypothetical protein
MFFVFQILEFLRIFSPLGVGGFNGQKNNFINYSKSIFYILQQKHLTQMRVSLGLFKFKPIRAYFEVKKIW